ncbi:MAG: hypothetical protein GC161_12265 [Planctomycetaceae bacterium]|nr:hypothetical protein [Planctomycetaceae bacterium]
MVTSATAPVLGSLLASRLGPAGAQFLASARSECAGTPSSARFGELLALASRHVRPGVLLEPTNAERAAAAASLPGWECERWTLLETLRVDLALALAESGGEAADATLEDAFRFSDEGETAALLRAAAHLPRSERWRWRVGEGCRSNMRSVFEAAACDTPYLDWHFDDDAFRQAALKCLFVGAPLWRMVGLERRLDATLARMALDYTDERRSAGRHVPVDLWLCLGTEGGARAIACAERELGQATAPVGAPPRHTARARAAAGLALLRAGERERVEALSGAESDLRVAGLWRRALAGENTQGIFRHLEPDAFDRLPA